MVIGCFLFTDLSFGILFLFPEGILTLSLLSNYSKSYNLIIIIRIIRIITTTTTEFVQCISSRESELSTHHSRSRSFIAKISLNIFINS